ncbi:helix-turn-helix domain-containing protein [uncultured Williamsia sp.]|uniref:winged helix-turn-helix transcriptional regulator n=1 Tax=uncultured Williamsia sp. TaxID=259311 RepID=UPI00262C2CCF|nr:helix-turn-helix domain-containing protein [uncultured Williamsia sp.]
MPYRSYQHHCAVSRALDVVGDRWSLLIVRELCGGPRRYSDLFADLPGISTDMLATRLRELEARGVVRRRDGESGSRRAAYELTSDGEDLRPILGALAQWGVRHLGDRNQSDAVREHWLAIPLCEVLAKGGNHQTINVQIAGGPGFHVIVADGEATHHDGHVPSATRLLDLDLDEANAIVAGQVGLPV